METTERIVEAYVRYVKGWATIPNVRCAGQNEIDLIAIDPVSLDCYHIEVSILISQGFRKLTAKAYDQEKAKERVHQASQRRTVGFFAEKKFGSASVLERLQEYGFQPGHYARVIVTWGWEAAAQLQAEAAGVELWDFRDIVREIAGAIRGSREYFTDDTLRTLNLFIHAEDESRSAAAAADVEVARGGETESLGSDSEHCWVYENFVHDYASIHFASCSYCSDGRGVHPDRTDDNSRWLGPFDTTEGAFTAARQTGRANVRPCGACSPASTD